MWGKSLSTFFIIHLYQGFAPEDVTGLAIRGGIDVHSVYATTLPRVHPSFSLQ
jgi:hypothetical protein